LHSIRMIDQGHLQELSEAAGLAGPSIVLEALDGAPERVALDPDRETYPASMIKLPIAVALAERCAAGANRWGDPAVVSTANLTTNDAPSAFVAGYETTLADLMRAMIEKSDNVATNVLIDVLGRDTIAGSCAAFGLRATAVRRKLSGSLPLIDDPQATGRNALPASDAARLFRGIAHGGVGSQRFVLAALEAQQWNDKLSRGLRPGDRFAHKTGDTDEVSHDGGILTLESGRRFVLAVFTSLPSGPESDGRFAAFARALRPYLDA
jgi:beta-lactamase class A